MASPSRGHGRAPAPHPPVPDARLRREPALEGAQPARSRASPVARIATASRPAFRPLPMATVATGTPAGIWAMESSESSPPSARL